MLKLYQRERKRGLSTTRERGSVCSKLWVLPTSLPRFSRRFGTVFPELSRELVERRTLGNVTSVERTRTMKDCEAFAPREEGLRRSLRDEFTTCSPSTVVNMHQWCLATEELKKVRHRQLFSGELDPPERGACENHMPRK